VSTSQAEEEFVFAKMGALAMDQRAIVASAMAFPSHTFALLHE
jgi:hypothetical protein